LFHIHQLFTKGGGSSFVVVAKKFVRTFQQASRNKNAGRGEGLRGFDAEGGCERRGSCRFAS